MEAVRSSETSVLTRATRRNIPEKRHSSVSHSLWPANLRRVNGTWAKDYLHLRKCVNAWRRKKREINGHNVTSHLHARKLIRRTKCNRGVSANRRPTLNSSSTEAVLNTAQKDIRHSFFDQNDFVKNVGRILDISTLMIEAIISYEKTRFTRFGVYMAVTMKNAVLWDVTPCGSCKNRRFGGK
jgi:hypothetical protein